MENTVLIKNIYCIETKTETETEGYSRLRILSELAVELENRNFECSKGSRKKSYFLATMKILLFMKPF